MGEFEVEAIFGRNQQSNWSSAWRGGGTCAIEDDYNDETLGKKYTTTNHKQWENGTVDREGERWRWGELAIGGGAVAVRRVEKDDR